MSFQFLNQLYKFQTMYRTVLLKYSCPLTSFKFLKSRSLFLSKNPERREKMEFEFDACHDKPLPLRPALLVSFSL